MKVDTTLIEKALADCEALIEDTDVDGHGSSALRLVVAQLGGRIQEQHPRFNTGAFQINCLPLQSERQKQAILAALALDKSLELPVEDIEEGDQFWANDVLHWTAIGDSHDADDRHGDATMVYVTFADGGQGERIWDRGTTITIRRTK